MRSDGSLYHVRIYLDTAVIKEDHQARPMPKGVPDGIRQVGDGGNPADMILQPGRQIFYDRSTSRLSHPLALLGGMSTNFGFDGIQGADPRQHFEASGDFVEV